ncbi:hypothetical protein ACTS9E_15275 [Empedobacter brevis]
MIQPIFIIGEKGSGKTTLGKAFVNNFDTRMYTLLDLIEEKENLFNVFNENSFIIIDGVFQT